MDRYSAAMTTVALIGTTLLVDSTGYGQGLDWAPVGVVGDIVLAEGPEKATVRIDDTADEQANGLEVFWVPFLDMEADIDEKEPGGDVHFAADIDAGSGWGLRYNRYNSKGTLALGAMYMGSKHTERLTDADVNIHAGYATVSMHYDLTNRLAAQVMLGVGGVVVDFSRGFDDTGGIAGLVTGGLRFQLMENLYAVADIGGFFWGYPGETIADGYVSTLGLAYRF